ncbi:MAG: M23 family metallopeptidase [Endomicrobia bacterium]|nr:M23 family metallopeptidase [Endomicrobiia bacterium]MCL2506735.1 M23 family metallopeptidase [Endomicrobiia bacterium]
MGIFSKARKGLGKKITVMLIPHGKIKPVKISVSLLFICVFAVTWTSLTVWSGFLVSQHIDYAKTKADNQIMKIRLLFFANQLEKTKLLVEKFQMNDEKIRSILALDSKKTIIEEAADNNLGKGGPTPVQANALSMILSGKINKIDFNLISKETSQLNQRYELMQKSHNEIMSHIKQQRSLFMATPRGWPTKGAISSPYGFRYHPFFRNKDFHTGIDIANAHNTPVWVTANGKVVFSGWQQGYGNIIVIDHGHSYRTMYGHLDRRLVKTGDFVTRGQEIAKMGSSGSATGPHLHYEIQYKGKPVNPVSYLTDYFHIESERNFYDQKKFKKFA